MLRRLLLFLLIPLATLPALAEDFSYTYKGKTLVYTVYKKTDKDCKTREGSNFNHGYQCGNDVSGNLILPSKAGDYTLTEISDYSFVYCKSLNSITIPHTVREVGEMAFFNCDDLREIVCASNDCRWYCTVGHVEHRSLKIVAASGFDKLKDCIFYQRKSADLVTFKQCVDEAGLSSSKFRVSTMPGIDIESISELHAIRLKIKEDDGARLTKILYNDHEIEKDQESGDYIIQGLSPQKKYKIQFKIENEYYDDWLMELEFETLDPIQNLSLVNATQTTLALNLTSLDNNQITNKRVIINGNEYAVDKNNMVLIKNLDSNTEYIVNAKVDYDGNTYYKRCTFTTLSIQPTISAEIGPTTLKIRPYPMTLGDARISGQSLVVNNKESESISPEFVNLPLNSKYEVRYFVNNEEIQRTISLPALKLNTLPARAASKDCAIICAETNMSEEEYGGGFEWRRYDAPDLVPSTFSPCPVANGHMEGRLKGLSQNTYYKYRPYYEDCNGDRTFGEWTAFITADADVYFEPTVYTYSAHSVTKTGATLVGYAIGGSEDVDEQGFEYWPIANSRSTIDVKRVLATGQRMIVNLEDLEPGTRYAVRAFASTKSKTTYGEETEFETVPEQIEDGIEQLTVEETEVAPFDIFTLQGVCVRRNTTDLSGLRPGLYIANGRKILVH